MSELSVRFTSEETTNDSPITVSLFRLDTRTSVMPAKFELPMDDKELAEIRWYLEEYNSGPQNPMLPVFKEFMSTWKFGEEQSKRLVHPARMVLRTITLPRTDNILADHL